MYPRPDKHADRIEDEAGLHRSHDSLDNSLFKLFVRIVQIKYAHRADYDGAENEHDMDVLAVDDDAGEYEGGGYGQHQDGQAERRLSFLNLSLFVVSHCLFLSFRFYKYA